MGLYLQLDQLIDRFLRLSHSIAQAINSDEDIDHVRAMDQELSDVSEAILQYETRNSDDRLKKSQFLIDQIVESDDQHRRQRLAEHLKNTICSP